MILECPNCQTCYETPAVLPEEGRKVKCARCAHVWHAMPTPDPEPEVETEPEIKAEPELKADPEPQTDSEVEQEQSVIEEPSPKVEIPQEMLAMESELESMPVEAIEPQAPDIESNSDEDLGFRDIPEAMEKEINQETVEEEALSEPLETLETLDDDGDFGAAEEAKPEKEEEQEENFGATERGEAVESEKDALIKALESSENEAQSTEKVPDIPIPPTQDIPIPPTMVTPPQEDPKKVMIGWAAFSGIVLMLLLSAYIFRVGIVKRLPTSVYLYAAFGIDVNIRGLRFEKLKHKWDTDKGRNVLLIAGEIHNVTSRTVPVPTIVFAFKDKSGAELYYRPKRVTQKEIQPGKAMKFSFKLLSPSKLVEEVELRFADSS